jgi:hypothetical protein
MAGTYTLRVDAGATLRLDLRFTYDTGELDEDDQPVYAAYDFTGATLRMQVRTEPGGTLLAGLSSVDGIEIGDDGLISVHLTAEQTAALTRGRYDIVCDFPSGDTKRLLEGTVAVSPQITEET